METKGYKVGPPTGPPKRKRLSKNVVIYSIIAIATLTYIIYNSVTVIPPNHIGSTPFENVSNRKILTPGVHFLDKFPFIVNVESGKCYVLIENSFSYDIMQYNVIHIHPGHVGVVYNKESNTPVTTHANPHMELETSE
jgi:hypothetical protein